MVEQLALIIPRKKVGKALWSCYYMTPYWQLTILGCKTFPFFYRKNSDEKVEV